MTLTLLQEPDYCDEPQLFCLIKSDLTFEDALYKFKEFDNEFVGPNVQKFGLKINFDLDL